MPDSAEIIRTVTRRDENGVPRTTTEVVASFPCRIRSLDYGERIAAERMTVAVELAVVLPVRAKGVVIGTSQLRVLGTTYDVAEIETASEAHSADLTVMVSKTSS